MLYQDQLFENEFQFQIKLCKSIIKLLKYEIEN